MDEDDTIFMYLLSRLPLDESPLIRAPLRPARNCANCVRNWGKNDQKISKFYSAKRFVIENDVSVSERIKLIEYLCAGQSRVSEWRSADVWCRDSEQSPTRLLVSSAFPCATRTPDWSTDGALRC